MEQNIKYYAVEAKCGHVRRSNYLKGTFAIKATSKKEAAAIVRYKPRVKHDHKDAIRSVREISYEEFLEILEINSNDNYFKVRSKQEQNIYCADLSSKLIKEDKYEKEENYDRDERLIYKKKKEISFLHEEEFLRSHCY